MRLAKSDQVYKVFDVRLGWFLLIISSMSSSGPGGNPASLTLLCSATNASTAVTPCHKLQDQVTLAVAGDTCTTELVLDEQSADVVDALRAEYEDYPIECRYGKDLCLSEWTYGTERKGSVVWPDTLVGQKRSVRCQFAYMDPVYVTRDCLLTVNRSTEFCDWPLFDQNFMNVCPDPPFTRATANITSSLKNVTSLNTAGRCESFLPQLTNLVDLRLKYNTDPVFLPDFTSTISATKRWMKDCGGSQQPPTRLDNINQLLRVVDFIFSDSLEYMWSQLTYEDDVEYYNLTDSLTRLLLLNYNTTEQFTFQGNKTTTVIQSLDNNRSTKYSLQLLLRHIISLNITSSTGHVLTGVRVFSVANSQGPRTASVTLTRRVVPATTSTTTPTSTTTRPKTTTAASLNRTNETAVALILDVPHLELHSLEYDVLPIVELIDYGAPYKIAGPMLFVDVSMDDTGSPVTSSPTIEIVFKHPLFINETDIVCAYRPLNAVNATFNIAEWLADGCSVDDVMEDTVRCRCSRSRGYFTALLRQPYIINIYDKEVMHHLQGSDLSTFLGFPYSHELYITGQVLRAISVVCLLATIITYMFFVKSRRSATNRILVNLCISLIVLLLVLYVAEARGGTRLGCRLSNVFRYYLVLVSLVWNGIEAHNMYRMLIKVFNSETSRFVLKASIVAWGAPAVAVAIALCVDRKAFDGTYLDCVFRCSLRDNTLYYGWLLPMSIIITHNIIVFALVVRVLCQKKPGAGELNRTKNSKDHWTRLCGACTMLVLLGIPWIFSAFGVISNTQNEQLKLLEGVFNVIFVVGVNLQGLFIFGFHCIRQKAIRDSWRSTIVTRLSTHSSSTTGSGVLTKDSSLAPRTPTKSLPGSMTKPTKEAPPHFNATSVL